SVLARTALVPPVDGLDTGGLEVGWAEGRIAVGLRRRKGAEDLVFTVEVSADGVNWERGEVVATMASDLGDGTERVVWTLRGVGVGLVRVRVDLL
ncbi:MAG: hypothetical protein P8J87_14940, partial [Verrucomicrobiales bacterium]|nr:hypothetical protein [Verrucomicrobiales bacterium]